MRLRELAFLADENVHPHVVAFLRNASWKVTTAADLRLLGKPDADVFRAAASAGLALLTHDRDFGALAVLSQSQFRGIFYLRPGHVDAGSTIRTLEAVIASDPDLKVPFILVARRRADEVTIRLRTL